MIRYRPGAALPQPLRLRPEMPSPFSPDGGGFYLPTSVETFHPAGASAEIPSIRSHTSGRQRTTLDEMNLQRGKGCTLAMRLWLVLRSEEHTSELQSLMRISYAVFCLKKKNRKEHTH